MTDKQIKYYDEMLKVGRLVPIQIGNRLVAIVTFYIGSIVDRYVRDDPWSVLKDEADTGTICFVDQLISDKGKENHKYSFIVWRKFKNYIRSEFPKVRVVRWNRVKGDKVYVYYKCIAPKKV
jgi:hypothetical protein